VKTSWDSSLQPSAGSSFVADVQQWYVTPFSIVIEEKFHLNFLGWVTSRMCSVPFPVCLTNRLNISLPSSLDAIGIAGFSHDFGSLKGKSPPVVAALESFGIVGTSMASKLIFLVAETFPPIINIPTKRQRALRNMSASIGAFGSAIVQSARAGGETDVSSNKSIIGTLGESTNSVF
jgi:hypothetical protein